MLNNYLIFLPKVQGDVMDEWGQCLEQICNIPEKGNRLVKLNIFIDLPDYETYIKVGTEIGNFIRHTFKTKCPSFNITVHPPEIPWKVVVEAGYVNSETSEIANREWKSVPYVVRITDTWKEIWAGGLCAGLFPSDTRKAANAAFDLMREILEAEQMSFNHIVRQWNFIGNILEVKNDYQNYQVFNKVRSENYNKHRSVHSYPAATGVGMKFGGVKLDLYAVKAESNLKMIAIDNPDQIRPYDYGQQVLKGKPAGGEKVNQPPQFERAVFLSNTVCSTLFVSGTASIIGQDTIGIGDVERQTVVTIENIGRLTDENRLQHLTGSSDSDTGRLILLRVYIKNQDDFVKVKSICRGHFPAIPAIYIQADICRDNLLVEIEAEFSKEK